MLDESEARERWNNWDPEFKADFIAYHEFNPRYATYAWAMLPYSVQQLVRATDSSEATEISPYIMCKCSACGLVYNMAISGGTECPECNWSGVVWVYHAKDAEEAAHVGYITNTPELTEQEKQGIVELERMLGYYPKETL